MRAWLIGGMVNNHEWYMRPTDPADAAKQATQKATQEKGAGFHSWQGAIPIDWTIV